jgi:nucleoside-diphosphate-sugar epimerase
LLAFIELEKKYFGPINLGKPCEAQIIDLARQVLKLIPESKSKIVYKSLPTDDPVKRKPDINRAKKILGWQPKVSLEEGLKRTIEYFRKITCHSECRV